VCLYVAPDIYGERLPLKPYTVADGLPNNNINKIVRDSRGFLWFCTGEGLSRFDGYSFTNYGVEQGLPHTTVNDFLETRNGELWIATGGGLVLFKTLWRNLLAPAQNESLETMSTDAVPSPAVSSQSKPLGVAIVEDHPEFREYLSALMSGTDGFKCLGSFRSVEEALPKLTSQVPDVMLIDIGLPGMNGIDGIRLFKERFPEILFLMLTIHDDDERIFDALCAGASGYLLKKTQPSRLVESVREVTHRLRVQREHQG